MQARKQIAKTHDQYWVLYDGPKSRMETRNPGGTYGSVRCGAQHHDCEESMDPQVGSSFIVESPSSTVHGYHERTVLIETDLRN